jgi:hypothetical protein
MTDMDRDELVALLDDIRNRVAAGDSLEGHIQYLLGGSLERPFQVAGLYRIGNRDGQGGARLIGLPEAADIGGAA